MSKKIMNVKSLGSKITDPKITDSNSAKKNKAKITKAMKVLSFLGIFVAASQFEISPAYKMIRDVTERILDEKVDQSTGNQAIEIRRLLDTTVQNASNKYTAGVGGAPLDALATEMYYSTDAEYELAVPSSVLLAAARQSAYDGSSLWDKNLMDTWNTFIRLTQETSNFAGESGLLKKGKLTTTPPSQASLKVRVNPENQTIIGVNGLYHNKTSLTEAATGSFISYLAQGSIPEEYIKDGTMRLVRNFYYYNDAAFDNNPIAPSSVFAVAKNPADIYYTDAVVRAQKAYQLGDIADRSVVPGLFADAVFTNNYYGTRFATNYPYCVFFIGDQNDSYLYGRAADANALSLLPQNIWRIGMSFCKTLDEANNIRNSGVVGGVDLGADYGYVLNSGDGVFIGKIPEAGFNTYTPLLYKKSEDVYYTSLGATLKPATKYYADGTKVNIELDPMRIKLTDGILASGDHSLWLEAMLREYNRENGTTHSLSVETNPHPNTINISEIIDTVPTVASTMYYEGNGHEIDLPVSVLYYAATQDPNEKDNAIATWKDFLTLSAQRSPYWLTQGTRALLSSPPTGFDKAYIKLTVDTDKKTITSIDELHVTDGTGVDFPVTGSNTYSKQQDSITGNDLVHDSNNLNNSPLNFLSANLNLNPFDVYSIGISNGGGHVIPELTMNHYSTTSYEPAAGLYANLMYLVRKTKLAQSSTYPYCAFCLHSPAVDSASNTIEYIYGSTANPAGPYNTDPGATGWKLDMRFYKSLAEAQAATFNVAMPNSTVYPASHNNGVWVGKAPEGFTPLLGNEAAGYKLAFDPLLATQTDFNSDYLTIHFNGDNTYNFGELSSNLFNTATDTARYLAIMADNLDTAAYNSSPFGESNHWWIAPPAPIVP